MTSRLKHQPESKMVLVTPSRRSPSSILNRFQIFDDRVSLSISQMVTKRVPGVALAEFARVVNSAALDRGNTHVGIVFGFRDLPAQLRRVARLAVTIESDTGFNSDDIAEAFASSPADQSGIESSPEIGRVFDLSYHFDSACESRRAWIYGLLAAERARTQFSLESARQQYEIAERNSQGVEGGITGQH